MAGLDPTALDILGYVASVFTSSSFAPQVWHTWRSKDVSGISLASYTIITIGLVLWFIYGLLRNDAPLYVANGVMICMTGAVVVMKIVYGGRKPPPAS